MRAVTVVGMWFLQKLQAVRDHSTCRAFLAFGDLLKGVPLLP
jgi:hypothetical protein